MFGRQRWVGAFQQPHHLGTGKILPLAFGLDLDRRTKDEAARANPAVGLCLLAHAIERLGSAFKQARCPFVRHRHLQPQTRRNRSGLAALVDPVDQRPAATRHATSALAVIARDLEEADGARRGGEPVLAAGEMRPDIARQALRHPVQGNRNLALEVEPPIIVEAVARVADAIADEDESGRQLANLLGHAGADGGVLGSVERHRPSSDRHGQRRLLLVGGAAERHLLEPGALVPCRLQPDRPELRCDIVGRDEIAFGAGIPPFEMVGRQELDVGAHPAGDVLLDRGGRLGLGGRGNDDQGGGKQTHQALPKFAALTAGYGLRASRAVAPAPVLRLNVGRFHRDLPIGAHRTMAAATATLPDNQGHP